MAEDYYSTLGVSKNASKEEIKKAYKTLAKKHHPDVSKDHGSEEKFKKISEAYAVLSDDQKKAQYDQFGETGFHQRYSQEDIFKNFNFNDLGDLFGSDIFEAFFGGGSRRRERRGRDLRYELDITFEEAAFGTNKKIELEKLEECSDCKGTGAENSELEECDECNGRGQVQRSQRTPFGMFSQVTACPECSGTGQIPKRVCKTCSGEGRLRQTKTLNVKIPAGVNTGSQLRVPNEGEAGNRGTRSGDLYIFLVVGESDIFKREGNDIYLELPLSFSQAALGDEIKIPTLEKEVTLKIPSGTQTGTSFRLAGKGIPYLDTMGKGDEFVVVNIVTPKKLTKEQRKLFEDLQKHEENKTLLDKIKEFAKKL